MDPRLGGAVEPARHPAEPRVVVGDLDPDPEPDLAAALVVVPADVDLQVAVAVGAALGDQEPLLDPPADDPVAGVHLVFGRLEGEQRQLRDQEHDRPLARGVVDVEQAEGEALQRRPVGARDALQVFGVPEPGERLGGQDDVGRPAAR